MRNNDAKSQLVECHRRLLLRCRLQIRRHQPQNTLSQVLQTNTLSAHVKTLINAENLYKFLHTVNP